jgi:DNA-binding NtrC family response regulator
MDQIKPNILVVDDEESMLITYKSILKKNYNPVLVDNGKTAIQKLKEFEFLAVILDLKMPDMDGIKVLQKIKELNPELDVVMATAINEAKFAIQAMRLGAYEYITKPFEIDELLKIINNIAEKQRLVKENTYLKTILDEQKNYFYLIGTTRAMKEIFNTIDNICNTDSTVLITGESGTGKELVAHAVHNKSNRKNGPMIIVNCAAIPENLIESELFGHERGAFTGAIEKKTGKFELAEGGTIFLDEIGCMPLGMQAKILRVLNNNTIDRVGGKKPIPVNVRVIAATNTELEQAIKENLFRRDLFYRINVIPIKLPPLRERKKDIPLFVSYFLDKYNKDLKKNIKGFSKEVMEKLTEYDWPGNVRELQNIIERTVALSKNREIINEIPFNIQTTPQPGQEKLKHAVLKFEKQYIKAILDETQYNQSETSRILGIHRTTLISKMRQHGL